MNTALRLRMCAGALGLALLGTGLSGAALAQEATIRRNLAERLPQLERIDDISRAPINGLYEVRVGSDIYYTDAEGNYLIEGQIIDTRQKRNLTQEKIDKLLAIPFEQLPLRDAFTTVRGNGKRKLAVFEDPNCGYCKRFERDLQKIDNVTVHFFLLPILGKDSVDKASHIWCAKDRQKARADWMLNNQPPPAAACDTAAIGRIVEFGRKNRISGTPTLFLGDGTRVPGAVNAQQLEKLLADAGK